MASSSPFVTYFIQPKFTLARLTKEDEIFSLIVALVKKVAPLVNDPKFMDLLEYVANLVENMVRDSDKIDRDTLIIRVYKEIFPQITDDDIQTLKNNIQYLKDNKLIHKIPRYKKAGYYFCTFFSSHVLN